MSGKSRVVKADLIQLAEALGDEHADELASENMGCIFARCLERARDLSESPFLFARQAHPVVRAWARLALVFLEEQRIRELASCEARTGPGPLERHENQRVESYLARTAEWVISRAAGDMDPKDVTARAIENLAKIERAEKAGQVLLDARRTQPDAEA